VSAPASRTLTDDLNLCPPCGYLQPMNMRLSISRTALGVLAALLLSGCAVFRTPPPLTPDASYEIGMAAHEAGRHGRAVEHLSRFVLVAAGDARLRDALMALARSQFASREYISAAATFLRVVTEFPRDPAAAEARYGVCDAYYRLSPRAQLDQQHTHTAITYCQSYAELYPQTPEAATARERVVEMHDKLAHKAYLNGLFYFRRNFLDSSLVYFGQVVETYPGTPWAPAALSMMVQAYERMGLTEDAEATREQLRRDYPQSTEARQPAA
jgi:outer membrane protein assembly factor BamD